MPPYFTPENERVLSRVNDACDRFEVNGNVQCTPAFRALLANTLSSIVEDPSPLWVSSAADRRQRYEGFIDGLDNLLYEMAEDSVDGKLTYFDGLHWLGHRLDSLCPFEKSRRRPIRAEGR
jgi:hypothetical protein